MLSFPGAPESEGVTLEFCPLGHGLCTEAAWVVGDPTPGVGLLQSASSHLSALALCASCGPRAISCHSQIGEQMSPGHWLILWCPQKQSLGNIPGPNARM